MALAVAGGASETRDLIVRALKPAGSKSMTAKYLAVQLGAPVRTVREELERMSLEGTVRARRHRSGEVLYRLKDRVDTAWDGLNGLSLPLTARTV
jgi:Predicted transcriptional regulator